MTCPSFWSIRIRATFDGSTWAIIIHFQCHFSFFFFFHLSTVEELSFDTAGFSGDSLLRYQKAWVTVRDRTHLLFGIKSCGGAEIYLSATAEYYTFDYFYRLQIQNESSYTSIWWESDESCSAHNRIIVEYGQMICHYWLTVMVEIITNLL